jgi:hypothetical protein
MGWWRADYFSLTSFPVVGEAMWGERQRVNAWQEVR